METAEQRISWNKSRKEKMMHKTSWLRASAVVFFFFFFAVAVPAVNGCRGLDVVALGSIFSREGRTGTRSLFNFFLFFFGNVT